MFAIPASSNALEKVFSVFTWLAVLDSLKTLSSISSLLATVSAFLFCSNLSAISFSSAFSATSPSVFNWLMAASSSFASKSLRSFVSSLSIKPFSCESSNCFCQSLIYK